MPTSAPSAHRGNKQPHTYNPTITHMDQNRHDDNLSLLGQSKATQYPTGLRAPTARIVCQPASRQRVSRDTPMPRIHIALPITGQPDFAQIIINYITAPAHGGEQIAQTLPVQLPQPRRLPRGLRKHHTQRPRAAHDPRYIEVKGIFTPRGGIAIHPFASYADDEHQGTGPAAHARKPWPTNDQPPQQRHHTIMEKDTLLIYSGGLDSTTLLWEYAPRIASPSTSPTEPTRTNARPNAPAGSAEKPASS